MEDTSFLKENIEVILVLSWAASLGMIVLAYIVGYRRGQVRGMAISDLLEKEIGCIQPLVPRHADLRDKNWSADDDRPHQSETTL